MKARNKDPCLGNIAFTFEIHIFSNGVCSQEFEYIEI
jgi:hypothetical protein